MKRPVPFIHQKKNAQRAIAGVFGNTNVQRRATREAMVELRDMAQEFINALDDDAAAGVKDESETSKG